MGLPTMTDTKPGCALILGECFVHKELLEFMLLAGMNQCSKYTNDHRRISFGLTRVLSLGYSNARPTIGFSRASRTGHSIAEPRYRRSVGCKPGLGGPRHGGWTSPPCAVWPGRVALAHPFQTRAARPRPDGFGGAVLPNSTRRGRRLRMPRSFLIIQTSALSAYRASGPRFVRGGAAAGRRA